MATPWGSDEIGYEPCEGDLIAGNQRGCAVVGDPWFAAGLGLNHGWLYDSVEPEWTGGGLGIEL